jgi:transcriptional regulator with XRE-family HTH domain
MSFDDSPRRRAMLKIKLFRLSRGKSQWEIATAAGMSQGRYSMIERGLIAPTSEERDSFAEVLGASASTLFRLAIRERRIAGKEAVVAVI